MSKAVYVMKLTFLNLFFYIHFTLRIHILYEKIVCLFRHFWKKRSLGKFSLGPHAPYSRTPC